MPSPRTLERDAVDAQQSLPAPGYLNRAGVRWMVGRTAHYTIPGVFMLSHLIIASYALTTKS